MPVYSRWLILGVLFFARTAMACQFQTVASTAPFLIGSFAIDYTRLGTLIGLYMLPGIFFALPGGMLGQRFGAKRLVLAGLLLMVAGGALMGAGSSFLMVATGRLVSGIGAVLINVLMTKMVADWFAGREIVTAMGLLVASWPLGLALGLLLFTPLAAAQSWNAVMAAAAALALVCLLLVAATYRDPPDSPAAVGPGLNLALTRREWLAVSLAGAVWTTYNVGYIVLISFVPELFTAHGYSISQASGVVSFLGWALIPAIPVAGYLAERLRRPDLFLIGGFLIPGLTAAALPFAHDPMLPFGILAAAVGAPAGLIMALPAQALQPQNRAGGMGVYFTWYYAGMAILPGLAGMARDLSASPAAPALFAAAMMALALAGLAGFRVATR
jgi:predicted MFS family arabinose efflux permease